jgi:ferredoxin-fold anticodon binding domain-containing protein
VSSIGFVAKCECEDAAQKVGTTSLFRHIYSGERKHVGCIQSHRDEELRRHK